MRTIELDQLAKIINVLELPEDLTEEIQSVLSAYEVGDLIAASSVEEYMEKGSNVPSKYVDWSAYAKDILYGPFVIGGSEYFVDGYKK